TARPRTSNPLPYTALFRSPGERGRNTGKAGEARRGKSLSRMAKDLRFRSKIRHADGSMLDRARRKYRIDFREAAEEIARIVQVRSEEHTSELQSRENLVCR